MSELSFEARNSDHELAANLYTRLEARLTSLGWPENTRIMFDSAFDEIEELLDITTEVNIAR